jgi:hypothetical protein
MRGTDRTDRTDLTDRMDEAGRRATVWRSWMDVRRVMI